MREFFEDHRKLLMGILILAIGAAGSWLLSRYISPAPPKTIVFTAGASDGAYYKFAQQYKVLLEQNDITLEVRESAGSLENIQRLEDTKSAVMAGFVQGGLGTISRGVQPDATNYESLQSLANVAFEPVWIFTRNPNIKDIEQLKGMRIAIGAVGSGTRKVALDMLQAAGLKPDEKLWLPHGGAAAAKALASQTIDAAFIVAAPESASVQSLLRQNGLYVADLAHANALARMLPYLQPISIPKGVFDLPNNIPARDITMLSTTANLVVSEDIHPALAYLLLDAAARVHSVGGALNRPGDFPQLKGTDFPVSDDAKRYFANGKPFLQRYMPFWAANFVQRLLLILIPLLAIVVPILRLAPALQQWLQERKLFKLYGQLKSIELDLKAHHDLDSIKDRLFQMQTMIDHTKFAKIFSDRVYTLRQHVDFVRNRAG